ncbi:MFS transporter [Streptomyces griseomycini]|uniref:MFS family permease n=1 Tax=Streptomyces griseomycini TaxID=66895 RepID=A0A7W7LZF6_9ACTN|nr:MFS transporter [Streptomyces griseomycini]MBB4899333.1 MFS family permease [Streptomyces griseomycini]GGQ27874.1 MFS transporter [Streptomyces griseomycini]GGR35594.1 MFS transporter [Streptomyces griseomycini]
MAPRSSAPPVSRSTDRTAGRPHDRRRAWLVTVMIVTFMVVNFADKSVLGLAAVPIMDELHISNGTYGLISSSFYLLFSLSGLVVGFFSSRISSRTMLFVMALLWAVAQLPVLAVAAVPTLIAGRVLLGAAEGPAASMSMHALYKWFPPERRGLPSALQIGGAAIGTLVSAPVLTWLITDFGWRSAYAALAVVSLLWALVWWRTGHDGPYDEARPPRGDSPRPAKRLPYRRLLLTGTVLGSIASAFGAAWALALAHAWLPAYLRTELDLSPHAVATTVSAVSALSLVLLLTVSPLMDALKARGVSSRWSSGAAQGSAVCVAACAMAAFPFADGPVIRLLLIGVAFGTVAVAIPLHYVTAAEVVPAAQRGAVFGIVAATGTLPGLIAPFVTGRLIDAAETASSGYATAFLIAAAVMLLSGASAVIAIRPEQDARRMGLHTERAPSPP